MTDQPHPTADDLEPEEQERPPRPSQAEGDVPEPDTGATDNPQRPPRPSQAEGDRDAP